MKKFVIATLVAVSAAVSMAPAANAKKIWLKPHHHHKHHHNGAVALGAGAFLLGTLIASQNRAYADCWYEKRYTKHGHPYKVKVCE